LSGCDNRIKIWGGEKFYFSALKVPRQCPFVLLVEIRLREGKALVGEEGKALGSGLCCEPRKKVELGLYCI
jgi:hypothetical protein